MVSPDRSRRVEHVLTIDLEEYFQVGVFADVVGPAEWPSLPGRLQPSVARLLDLLEEVGVTATFFAGEWIASHRSNVIRRVTQHGHEVAVKATAGEGDTPLDATAFRAVARTTRARLQDISGRSVFGHRGGRYTFAGQRELGLDILIEEGFLYDSSPTDSRMDRMVGDHPPDVRVLERPSGRLLDLPVARASMLGVPLGSAGRILRQLPYAVARKCLARHERNGQSAVLRVRSWEIDPYQPRLSRTLAVRVRHYGGLERMLPRMARLLSEFRFTSAERRFGLARGDGDEAGKRSERLGALGR